MYKVGDLEMEMGHMIEALREVEARLYKRRIHYLYQALIQKNPLVEAIFLLVLQTCWDYLTSAGFFTHRAASTLWHSAQKHLLEKTHACLPVGINGISCRRPPELRLGYQNKCHAKAILAIVLFLQHSQGLSS